MGEEDVGNPETSTDEKVGEESGEKVTAEGADAEAADEAVEPDAAVAEADEAPAEDGITLGEGEVMEAVKVERHLFDWLVGPCEEVEQETKVRMQLIDDENDDEYIQVQMVGKPEQTAKAREMLEEKIMDAPDEPPAEDAAEDAAAEGAADDAADEAAAAAENTAENPDVVDPADAADATAPAEDAAEEEPAVPAEEVKKAIPCIIAGRIFADHEELNNHIRRLENSCKRGNMFGPEDSFFLFHLSTFHPQFSEKMTSPIVGFRFGDHESASKANRMFYIIRSDGSEEGINAKRCVDNAIRQGVKRAREDHNDGRDAKHARTGEREIMKGCVVVVDGAPTTLQKGEMRDILNEFGVVKFMDFFLEDEAAAAEADKEAEDVAAEEKKEEAEKEEGVDADAAKDAKEDGDVKEVKAGDDEENGDDTKEDATAAGDKEKIDEKSTKAAPVKKLTVKVRFGDAASAKKCAEELVEIQGIEVAARIMEGEEERQFWEELFKVADAKGVGRGGKAKSKGSGSRRESGRGRSRSRSRRNRRSRSRRGDRRGRRSRDRGDRRSRDRRPKGSGKGSDRRGKR